MFLKSNYGEGFRRKRIGRIIMSILLLVSMLGNSIIQHTISYAIDWSPVDITGISAKVNGIDLADGVSVY